MLRKVLKTAVLPLLAAAVCRGDVFVAEPAGGADTTGEVYAWGAVGASDLGAAMTPGVGYAVLMCETQGQAAAYADAVLTVDTQLDTRSFNARGEALFAGAGLQLRFSGGAGGIGSDVGAGYAADISALQSVDFTPSVEMLGLDISQVLMVEKSGSFSYSSANVPEGELAPFDFTVGGAAVGEKYGDMVNIGFVASAADVHPGEIAAVLDGYRAGTFADSFQTMTVVGQHSTGNLVPELGVCMLVLPAAVLAAWRRH